MEHPCQPLNPPLCMRTCELDNNAIMKNITDSRRKRSSLEDNEEGKQYRRKEGNGRELPE